MSSFTITIIIITLIIIIILFHCSGARTWLHHKTKQTNNKTNRVIAQQSKLTERHELHYQLYPYAPLPCKIVKHIQQYSPKYHKEETSLKSSYHNIIGSLPLHSEKVTQSFKQKFSLRAKHAI